MVLRHNWWIGLALIALGALSGFFIASQQHPVFEAGATGIVVATEKNSDTNSALAADSLAKSKATSYVSVASSQMVAKEVKAQLRASASESDLLSRITVVSPNATNVLRVMARGDSPQAAQELAAAWVKAAAKVAKSIDQDSSVQLQPLGTPALPSDPISPNTKLLVAAGAAVGFLLSVAVAGVRMILDRRIRSRDSVTDLDMSVVAAIPLEKRLRKSRGVTGRTGVRLSFGFDEAIRELRTNLSYVDVDNPPRTLVLTSAAPGEGKSSVSANLASAMAAAERTVILIDTDLRRPTVADTFGLPKSPGLTDVLSGRNTLDEALQKADGADNLWILPSGHIPPNPSELLGSQALRTLLGDLSTEATLILDAPPVLPVTDAVVLSTVVDATILVAAAGRTTIDQLKRAWDAVEAVGAKPAGVVLNRVPTRGPGAGDYDYYAAHYYSPEGGNSKSTPRSRAAKRDRRTSGRRFAKS